MVVNYSNILDSGAMDIVFKLEKLCKIVKVYSNASMTINGGITGVMCIGCSNIEKALGYTKQGTGNGVSIYELTSINSQELLLNREILLIQLVNNGIEGLEIVNSSNNGKVYAIVKDNRILPHLSNVLGSIRLIDTVSVDGVNIKSNNIMIGVDNFYCNTERLVYDQSGKKSYLVRPKKNIVFGTTSGILCITSGNKEMDIGVKNREFKGVIGNIPNSNNITYKNTTLIVENSRKIFSTISELKSIVII